MSALFAADDAGRLTASIPDAKGELREYELTVAPCDWPALLDALADAKFPPHVRPEWACRLVRLDTEESYFVARIGPARFWCQCSDYKYRSHKSPDGCKHIGFGRAFRAMLRAVAQSQGVAA